jgi:hypothetical protein
MKNIINRNSKDQYHGQQEWYNSKGELELRGTYKKSEEIGYEEWHAVKETRYYII